MLSRLLRNRYLMLRNHGRSSRGSIGLAVALLGVACIVLVAWFASAAIRQRSGAPGFDELVRDWSFGLSSLMLFFLGYGSLQVLFRDAENRVLHQLPLAPRPYFAYKLWRIAAAHAPFLAIPLTFALALLLAGQSSRAVAALLLALPTFLFAVGIGLVAHVVAGCGMLSGNEQLKKLLAGGVGPRDSAFFFYAPAGVLTASLSFAVLQDLALKTLLAEGLLKPLLAIDAAALLFLVWALRRGLQLFEAHLAQMIPKFNEIDVVRELREGEQRQRLYAGHQLGALLTGPARALYQRDWLQLRRRHRIGPVVLVLVLVVWALIAVRAGRGAWVTSAWALLSTAGALFFSPAFKLYSDELESEWVLASFPLPRSAVFLAKWLCGVPYQLVFAVTGGALYGLLCGDWLGALILAPATLVTMALLHAGATTLAAAARSHVRWGAAGYYLVVATLGAFTLSLV